MTEQRIFPFFINGRYWKTLEVTDEEIKKGIKEYIFLQKLKCRLLKDSDVVPEMMAKMQKAYFQLAIVREYYPENKPTDEQTSEIEYFKSFKNHMAEWFSGFWVCNDNLYFDDNGNVYVKEQQLAEVK